MIAVFFMLALGGCSAAPLLEAPALGRLATAVEFPRRGLSANTGPPAPSAGCIVRHCSGLAEKCIVNRQCLSALTCNAKCQKSKEVDACNLLCELTYGYNCTEYKEAMQCMVDNNCFPQEPPDGTCLATDNQTITNLVNMSQVAGKWWIIKGLNCGQEGWPAAFDYFPCQRDEFVFDEPNNRWVDHIAYTGGKNNTPTTPIVNTVANVSMTSPGVMTHWYTDPPLTPQTEEWRVLSWPGEGDWMLYIYCGSTPMGPYAGGSVVSRGRKKASDIPAEVEAEFRLVGQKFGFAYDEMCVSDVFIPQCTD